MPGHPRCGDEDARPDPATDHEAVVSFDDYKSSNGSMDSLLSELCDDPASTLCIPDAVITSPMNSRSPSPPPSGPSSDGVEETDSGILQDQDVEEIFHIPNGSRNSGLCEEDIGEQWCPTLYTLQCQAPKPRCLLCKYKVENTPPQYGMEYHGIQSKEETLELLGSENGSYLIRSTERGHHILSFIVDGRMYNYRLFYEEGLHFVGEKKFDSLQDLVEDGLITLYLQKHGVAQAMEEGRHNTLARKKTQKKLKRKHGKRVKGLKGKAAWDYRRSKSSNSASHSPSPSPVVSPGPIPNRDIHNLILNSELDMTSQSAPHTPTQPITKVTPNSNSEQSDLDFSSTLRLSTPNLCIISSTPTDGDACELRLPKTVEAVGQSSPLAQRRAKSTSSIQKDVSRNKDDRESEGTFKDKRYSAIFATLRDVVKEDRFQHSKSMDARYLKAYSSDSKLPGQLSRSLADDLGGVGQRRYSCSSNKAFTLSSARVRDVSLHGTTTLNRRSLVALAKHTTGPSSVYFKAHKFEMHSYKCPTWCEICHHFLWGLKQQGMRCQDCGMDIHKQCLPVAMQLECFPNKQFIKKVFGVDLTTVVKMEGGLIPKILSRCFEELQSRDLSVQGVYRLSGQSSEIIDLKEKFNQGEAVDLSQYQDINIITGVIKLYLRELPIPLITFDAYKEIMKSTVAIGDLDDPSTDLSLLSDVLKLLPKSHYNTLKHLAQHLSHVESHSNDNKMSAHNLAVVFAPTLMRAPSDDTILVQDLPVQKYFVECLILKHDVLFR